MTDDKRLSPRVENLARAMAAALDFDPDEKFSHNSAYDPFPSHRDRSGFYKSDIRYSANWHRFAWEANKWIYENSGGELP